MAPSRTWTGERLERMKAAAEAGKTLGQFCRENNEKHSSSYKLAKRLGIVFAEHKPITSWTDERIEKLCQLWRDGYSATQIAKEIGGLTRSAVLGKLHRMNLTADNRASHPSMPRALAGQARPRKSLAVKRDRYAGAGMNMKRSKPSDKSPPVHSQLPPTTGTKTLVELNRRDCRFVCDDGLFCASPTHNETSWCAAHHRVVFWRSPKPQPSATELMRSLRKYV